MNKKILLMIAIYSFWLMGCSGMEGESEGGSSASVKESSNMELLDQPFEQITLEEWKSIHLSKTDFDRFISQLPAEPSKDGQKIAGVKMEPKKISVILDNHDGESLENLIAAPFIDTKIRQVYNRSAYYDGQQPSIFITDLSGVILSDTAEPLEAIYP